MMMHTSVYEVYEDYTLVFEEKIKDKITIHTPPNYHVTPNHDKMVN